MVSRFIFSAGGGRLGNQLLTQANLLAFGIKHPKFDIINIPMLKYGKQYFGTSQQPTTVSGMSLFDVLLSSLYPGNASYIVTRLQNEISSRIATTRIDPVQILLLHWVATKQRNSQSFVVNGGEIIYPLPGEELTNLDLEDGSFLQRIRDVDNTVVAGWGLRCWPLVFEYSGKIRLELQPADYYYRNAADHLDEFEKNHDLLMGVHIRRGDYSSWQDGMYFFDPETYNQWVNSIRNERFPDRDVGFIVSSDESLVEREHFSEDHYLLASGQFNGSYIDSFVQLSLCDYIMAPPSTYSGMAAFIGDTPLFPLYPGRSNWVNSLTNIVEFTEHTHMSTAFH